MNKIIELLTNKFAGRIVTKLVTAAAAALVAHGAMKPAQEGAWITANADWLTGVVLSALSIWLSKYQHETTQATIATALATPPPVVTGLASPTASPVGTVTTGGVGIGNTATTKGN